MQALDRVQSRMRGLVELGELMRALRVLAAAHLAEAQAALPAALAYRETLRTAWADLPALGEARGLLPPLQVLIGAEHGFTGAYVERLLGLGQQDPGPLLLVGRRAVARARERRVVLAGEEEMSTRPATVPDLARRLARRLRCSGRAVTLIHAVYRQGGRFELGRRPLWPLPSPEGRPPTPPRTLLSAPALHEGVGNERLVAELVVALLEALASENAARMTVLDAAQHSLEGKLAALKVEERSARQGAITAELLDLVTGAEAQITPRR